MRGGKYLYKVVAGLLILSTVVLFSACKKEEVVTKKVLIPNSYLKYSGMSSNDFSSSVEEFVNNTEITEEGVLIFATEEQINTLIENNNSNIESYIESFESISNRYSFVGSDDYSVFELHCDERLNNQKLFITIATISSTYGLNNILYNNSADWDVRIKIVNCFTEKTVIEGSIINDDMAIDSNAWEKSHN